MDLEERSALQMSRLQAVPFVLNTLQVKSNLKASTIKKALATEEQTKF